MSRLNAFGLAEDGEGGGDSNREHGEIRVREPHVRESDPHERATRESLVDRAERIANRIDGHSRDDVRDRISRNPDRTEPARVADSGAGKTASHQNELSFSVGSSGFAQFLMFPAVGYQAMAGVRGGPGSGAVEAYGGGFVGAGGIGLAFFLPGATASISWGSKSTSGGFSKACQPAAVVSVAIFQVTVTGDSSSMDLDSVSLSVSEGLGLGVVGGVYCGVAARDKDTPLDPETEMRRFIRSK